MEYIVSLNFVYNGNWDKNTLENRLKGLAEVLRESTISLSKHEKTCGHSQLSIEVTEAKPNTNISKCNCEI